MKLAIAAALAASVSAKCYKGITMKYYTDEECETKFKKNNVTMNATVTEDDAKAMNEKCNELDEAELTKVAEGGEVLKTTDGKKAGYMKITCDTKAIKTELFEKGSEEKCDGDAIASMEIEWKKCTKVADTKQMKLYAIATGSQALAATAAAAFAMVASQF